MGEQRPGSRDWRRLRRTVEWLEDRTGLPSALRDFLLEDIPASAGWPQVFGSVALFLFSIQALTGILLALNYAPTPGDAYRSILYLVQNITGGRMIRGLHHWGASLMIITTCLHMAQVFIYSAYKKPREATWIIGVCLLLLTLAFGLTGYLLPWDNRAYWGTMVTTKIMLSIPLAGSFLARLFGFSDGIGVLTFSRFYAAHTMLLPAVMVFLVVVHVGLVRRHGVAPGTTPLGSSQKFYPKQAWRDVIAVFVAFIILFAAAALLEVPLERLADPTDKSYTPRPEWYFLFLFQLLKVLPGPLEFVGTVILPSLAILLLVSAPFFPVSRFAIWNRRSAASVIVLLVFAAWGGLTAASLVNAPRKSRPAFVPAEAADWTRIEPELIAGLGYFHSSHCDSCHNLLTGFPKPGPNLGASPVHHPKEWLVQHFTKPGTGAAAPLGLPQLNALSLFVENQNAQSAALLQGMSLPFVRGAQVYVAGACASCHMVNGIGGGVGPRLNGLANRRTPEWVEKHFLNPARLSPGSNMPAYRFKTDERDALIVYLFALAE
jgi:ubiquinol-cytochrome c reductase cytochrome b subunit